MTAVRPVNHLPDAAYAFAPFNKPVMTRHEARETIASTGGWIMAKGYQWDLRCHDLGAGMVRIELEERR